MHAMAHGMLHNNPQHNEITALCRLCAAAAAFDETNGRAVYSEIGNLIFH